jgi:hypothetical protein
VCGEDGQYFGAKPRVEQLHFTHRALWDLHRLRQALERGGLHTLALVLSDVITKVDRLASILLNKDH